MVSNVCKGSGVMNTNFDNMKTLDEILNNSSIKNITKFIKKRDCKEII